MIPNITYDFLSKDDKYSVRLRTRKAIEFIMP